RAFFEIGQVFVGQVHVMPAHIFTSEFDEIASNPISHSPRSAVEHEPHTVLFIKTNLNEVVAGAEGSEMMHIVAAGRARMLREDALISLVEIGPNVLNAVRQTMPCAAISGFALIGTSVWNRFLDRGPEFLQAVR